VLTQTKPKARSAPRDGYDFEAKAKYRLELWQSIRDELGPALWGEAHVGILPSSEGLEIDTLVALGMQPNRIHAFDRSAAILATAKWRKVYPEVRVYAGEIGRTIGRVAEAGHKLRALNLDLCGGFTAPMVQTVSDCVKSNAMHGAAVVAVTAMKGRKSPAFFAALGMTVQPTRADALLSVNDDRRKHSSYREWYAAERVVDVFFRGEYKSTKTVMQYAVARVTRHGVRHTEKSYHVTAEMLLEYSANKAERMLHFYRNSTSHLAKRVEYGEEWDWRGPHDMSIKQHRTRRDNLKPLIAILRESVGNLGADRFSAFEEGAPLRAWFSLGSNIIGGMGFDHIHRQVLCWHEEARAAVPFWDTDESYIRDHEDFMEIAKRRHLHFIETGEIQPLSLSADCGMVLLFG
jgi:hypothetical protein